MFNKDLVLLSLLCFISLCFVSSSYYIINDIKDIKKDKLHPEKKKRLLASGRIDKLTAFLVSLIMLIASLLIAVFLPFYFLVSVISLFLLSLTYTFIIRDIAFMDLILISINFVIRAVAGTFVIGYALSYWVILCTFFIALFLVSVKRCAEINLASLKEYRPNFSVSDKQVLEFIAIFSATALFVFFSIYSILHEKPALLLSLPFALYITFMFFHDLYKNPMNVRNPEKFIFQKKIMLSLILWFLIVIIALYFSISPIK
jgi:4-hydroxybenzoate polyprenyltransferase